MGVSIDLNMLMKEMFPMILVLSLACTLLHMTITLCNFHPFTFYVPFHTSPPVDQCPIHAPSTCTMGLDPCAQKVTVIFYSPCGLKRLVATLAFPLLCKCIEL